MPGASSRSSGLGASVHRPRLRRHRYGDQPRVRRSDVRLAPHPHHQPPGDDEPGCPPSRSRRLDDPALSQRIPTSPSGRCHLRPGRGAEETRSQARNQREAQDAQAVRADQLPAARRGDRGTHQTGSPRANSGEEREARRHSWKSVPTTDDVPTGRLRLTVYRDGWLERGGSNRDEWDDAPKKPLSDQIATIARAIKKGVIDDQDAHARAEQARAEAQERYDQERVEQQRAWDAQRQKARAKAAEQLRRAAFAQAMDDWRAAQDLRAFCDELGAVAAFDEGHLPEWIAWARQSADELDAAAQARRLNELDFEVVVTTDDIEPYMEGWSTRGPYKASPTWRPPPSPPFRSACLGIPGCADNRGGGASRLVCATDAPPVGLVGAIPTGATRTTPQHESKTIESPA